MNSRVCRLVVLILALASATLSLAQEFVAPPLRLAPSERTLATASRILVREFRFEGNTRFSGRELARIVAPYTGRELSAEELEDARRDVTLYYVTRGYINSGAVLPEQDAKDGIVLMRIIEGRLTDINLTGNRWLRRGYVVDRLQEHVRLPLNVDEIRDGLQLLRDNPNIQQVNAELHPGPSPGESYLNVRLREQQPFRAGVQVDNERPPSVGSEEVLLLASDRNLTGHSDPLDLTCGIAEGGMGRWKASGLDNVGASYAIPLTSRDTTLRVYGNRNDFAIIEAAFVTNSVNVTSESYRAGASLRQPLYQTSQQELAVGLTFERRYSETFINGMPASISPGDVNGREQISALRFYQEWMGRDQEQVLGLRSTMSWGVPLFSITDNTNRDARFFAWQGQSQYVRRLFGTPNQLILRLQGQWTSDKLLSLEQFSVGGAETVRGYRENELLFDRGLQGTAELRLPVLLNGRGESVIQLAPFFDFGGGSLVGESAPHPETISSAGIGLLLTPNKHVNAQLYWGHPFANLNNGNNDPQDLGLHFKVSVEMF